MVSSAIGYVSYLIFHNFFILLIAVSIFNGLRAATMPQIYAYAQESANASKSDDKSKQIMLPFIAFILLFAVNAINGINTPLFNI